MKKIFTISLSTATLIVVTACSPSKPASEPATASAITASPTTASQPVMNHDAHMNHMASAATSQPPHIMAYMDVMDTMHKEMSAGMQAKNADVGFAKGMIPHHQGAIAMAKIELQYGKDPEMKALAQKIIDAQQGEIKLMTDWLANNEAKQPTASNLAEITQAYQAGDMKNHDAMMQGMMETDPDIAFAKGMIPHHQGAIDMAAVELKYGKTPEMLKLAEQIKQAQTPEIKQMQDWLAKKGAK